MTIPGRLNLALSAGSALGCITLLTVASHTRSWVVLVGCAVLFSFLNNTVFSLLHESVHKILHPDEGVNEWVGRGLAVLFPTSLGFQRVMHLNHHAHNRSDQELFDYLQPGDNKLLKYAQWYGLLTGIYWLLPPTACVVYMLWPGFFQWSLLRRGSAAFQTAAATYAKSFDRAAETTVRLEVGLALLVHLAGFQALGWTPLGWGLCYAAFALNWSSLQYADHAFSERDPIHGAWNLRVNRLTRLFFLDYHHHKAHHENPKVPWIHLHRFVTPDEERPWFGDIYRQMWAGPRPLPPEET